MQGKQFYNFRFTGGGHRDQSYWLLLKYIRLLHSYNYRNRQKTMDTILGILRQKQPKNSESFGGRFFLNYCLFGNRFLQLVRLWPPPIDAAFKVSVINKGRNKYTLLQLQ